MIDSIPLAETAHIRRMYGVAFQQLLTQATAAIDEKGDPAPSRENDGTIVRAGQWAGGATPSTTQLCSQW